MTDSGRPEPVAWICKTHNSVVGTKKLHDELNIDGCTLTPLYPPSIVAGELYEMASWINKTFGDKPDGTHNDELDETVLELARRGKAWEAK